MDAADIAALCEAMSLKELEGSVRRLEGDLKTGGVQKLSLCLVGKVLANKLINREVFKRVLLRIWKVRESITIEMVRENVFMFHFQNQEDRQRVLTGGPWSFDNFLIVLDEPNWKGYFLGSLIGDVEELDEGAYGDCDGKFIRVRVIINVDQPLRRILRVDVLGDGEESVMLLRYERLSDHCHKCGKLGHKMIECTTAGASSELLFGAWLKAGIPIVRPLMQGRAPFRQSSASSAESPCDRVNSASVLSRPSSSIGTKSQVVEKMHGSDGGMTGTAMEGVGKGKEKIVGIMGADSRTVISASQEGRKLNVIDEITGVTTNKPVFEFSSQRSKVPVLNDSEVKTKSPISGLGCPDIANGPKHCMGKDLVVSSFPTIGPRALVKEGGPDLKTTLAGSGSSNKSQASRRWKRGALPKSSDSLVEVEVCGNYNLVQEEWQPKLSLTVAASDSACVGEYGISEADLAPIGTAWPQDCGGVVTGVGSTVGIE
ncbi:hypothetical protein EZV62_024609 [Acer yangbiense]|uniref:CCHC-type domain-containing protein n=1 Tax=Acer yangbiense TaxID=1000413 RepID=A0A5C7GVA6_9ROSI|nr:hypothetical protein EZV62_024609 [Acer yangbiense]